MSEEEQAGVALVLIDVIDNLNADDSRALVEAARLAAPRILALRERAHESGVPVIYVNHGSAPTNPTAFFPQSSAGGDVITRMLVPTEQDYLVVKSRPSGFEATELQSLLEQVKARTVVLAGFSADGDLLPTASDARARGYDVVVPADCTASSSDERTQLALTRMRSEAGALTDDSQKIDLRALRYGLG